MTGGNAGRDAVIHHHAVFAQHKSVAAASRLQVIPIVGVEQIQKARSIRTTDINLAQGRCIKYTDAASGREAFTVNRRMHILAFPGIEPGTLPLSDVLKHCAAPNMPGVNRSLAHRVKELLSQGAACDRSERHRRIVRTERCRSHFSWRLAQCLGEYREPVDITELALIGTKTQCGITLDVLNRPVALTGSQSDIRSRRIVLEIQKLLDAAAR